MARRFHNIGEDLMLDPAELAQSPAAVAHTPSNKGKPTDPSGVEATSSASKKQTDPVGIASVTSKATTNHLSPNPAAGDTSLGESSFLGQTVSSQVIMSHSINSAASPAAGGGVHAARRGSVVSEYVKSVRERERQERVSGGLALNTNQSSVTDTSPLTYGNSPVKINTGGSSVTDVSPDDRPYIRSRLRKLSFVPGTVDRTLLPKAHEEPSSGSAAEVVAEDSGFFEAHKHLVPSPSNLGTANTPAIADPAQQFKRSSGNFRFNPGMYKLQYPESLYGPYAEKLPAKFELGAKELLALSRRQHSMNNGGSGGGGLGSTLNLSTTAGSLREINEDGTKSLAEIARALSQNARAFEEEWRSISLMKTHSLSQLGAKLQAQQRLAEEFANAITHIAVKIIEERNAPPSQKVYRPVHLSNYEGSFLVQGNIFVLSETPSRVALYGGREGAHRAALNELRAVRTALGAPFVGVNTPLCCTVSHMGFTVFVSAPLNLPINCSRSSIVYGSFSSEHVFTEPIGKYTGFRMAEYVPLVRHSAMGGSSSSSSGGAPNVGGGNNANLNQTQAGTLPQKHVYTGNDVKQFYMKDDGAILLLDSARWMPPAVCASEFSKTKTRDDASNTRVLSRHPIEDEKLSYLSVLFRPEYMRNSCVVSLNCDAGTPGQLHSQQENIGYALHNLYTNHIPQLASDLVHMFIAKELTSGESLSKIFHAAGVNMRYLGRVFHEIDMMPPDRSANAKQTMEAREGLKHLLAIEAAARTFKSVLYDEFSEIIRVKQEEQVLINRMQLLLMTQGEDSSVFWDNQMKDRMESKFGLFVCPAVAIKDATDGTESHRGKVDPNSLKVYHAIRNTKVVVEKTPEVYQWVRNDAGYFTVDPQSIATNSESESSTSTLFPLLGPNARENSALMIRALQVTGIDMVSDIRGKKINVTFKPKVKTCSPLLISPALQAVFNTAPDSIQDSLVSMMDPLAVCEAVESAAKSEIYAMMKHSETDPRATMPLRLMAMAQISKGVPHIAYQTLSRWYELRKTHQLDVVTGYSAVDIAKLFMRCNRPDRAESLLVDGLKALRFAADGLDVPSFCNGIFEAAGLVNDIVWGEGSRPAGDRIARVLEYYQYACFLAEQMKHPSLPFIVEQIATLRRKYANNMRCASCGASATCVSHQHDIDGVEGVKEMLRDAVSNTGSRTTQQTTAQQRRQQQQQRNRIRRGVDEKKEEEKDVDVFTKSNLEPISTLHVEQITAVPDDDSTRVILFGLLQGVAKASVVVRPQRYMCDKCCPQGSNDTEPIQNDTVRLFKRTVSLMHKIPHIPVAGDPTLGNALVTLGVLQGDPDLTQGGIQTLSDVYDPTSRQVINAELQLADVLIRRSATVCRYTGPSRDVQCLSQAEAVLHKTLDKLLAKPDVKERHSQELSTVVRSMQQVVEIYSEYPVAKKEHQALHYLVDTLMEHLGETHHLTGAALGQIKSYYVHLSTIRKDDPISSSTALQTAGQYATQWLRCRVAGDELGAADDIESHLTVIRDDIIKVLRAGGAQERQAATDIAATCQFIVQASAFANDEKVVAALKSIDDAFKTQLKVIEQSERTERVLEKINDWTKQMHQCVANIKRHANGTDRYAKSQVERMHRLRDLAVKKSEESNDPLIAGKVQQFLQLHNELLHINEDGSAHARTGGGSNATGNGAGVNGESTTANSNGGAQSGSASGVYGSPASPSAGGQYQHHHHSKSRAYESPYAFLGMGTHNDNRELMDFSSHQDDNGGNGLGGRGKSVRGGLGPGTSHSRSAHGVPGLRQSKASSSAINAFATMTERSGRSKQTTEQLTKMFPKLSATAAKKNFSRVGNN